MATYRGMTVSDHLRDVMPYMDFVHESREALNALAQRWDLLDVLSRVLDIPTGVDRTRAEFQSLNEVLIEALADESLKKVTASIGAKAQVVADILVRNLFERTADIGFLATDEDLRKFLVPGLAMTREDIRMRLVEYRAKYSVYRNVVVMDLDGRICAAAQEEGLPDRCEDAFVQQALTRSTPYVETFDFSDLSARAGRQLIYSCRIADPAGCAVGVLALLFDFTDELTGIFGSLLGSDDWTVAALLDADGGVLASSDIVQLPIATKLAIDLHSRSGIIRLAGRRYLAAARQSAGYQGYVGPGWYGCALIPIDAAFDGNGKGHRDSALDDGEDFACDSEIFSAAVRSIPRRAAAIQAALNLTVWNGTVVIASNDNCTDQAPDGAASRRTLLAEISATGAQTRKVFADAIATLNQTAISTIASDCAAAAALAVDIMDRNLYERANDCRWWALTTRFREALAAPEQIDQSRAELTAILRSINDLYTVYTNLILFDRDGRVQAVSDPDQVHLVGTYLPDTLARRFTARAETQFYGVSDFHRTSLYADRATYIYGAPVLHPDRVSQIVGGIAVVFDSTPQLRSMLEDALPIDAAGNVLPGAQLVFVDGAGHVLSSTSDAQVVGARLTLPIPQKDPASTRLLCWDETRFAVGSSHSQGYREYKGPGDAYRNPVEAICIVPIGTRATDAINVRRAEVPARAPAGAGATSGARRIATFQVGSHRLALPCETLVEAMIPDQMARTAERLHGFAGYAVHQGRGVLVLDARGYFDLPPMPEVRRPIIVFRTERGLQGLAVDALGEAITVSTDQIQNPGLGVDANGATGVEAMIHGAGDPIILLDPDAFLSAFHAKRLTGGAPRISTPDEHPSLQ